MIYQSFEELMENNIIPLHKNNSDWIRLDGRLEGGNRKIYALFMYESILWKIHSDTRFEPLEIAYEKFKDKKDPFNKNQTRGGNLSLKLKDELKYKKHLYIYKK